MRVDVLLEAVQPGVSASGWAMSGDHVGKHVLVGEVDACGECDVCRRGGAPVCPHATRRGVPAGGTIPVNPRWLVVLDDDMPLPRRLAAAVAGDVTLAYTLYARANVGPRDPVVVVGTDAVAAWLRRILAAKGITPTDAQVGDRPAKVLVTNGDLSSVRPRAQVTMRAGFPIPAEVLAHEVTITAIAGAHPDLVIDVAAMCAKGELDLAAGTTGPDAPDPSRTTVTPV